MDGRSPGPGAQGSGAAGRVSGTAGETAAGRAGAGTSPRSGQVVRGREVRRDAVRAGTFRLEKFRLEKFRLGISRSERQTAAGARGIARFDRLDDFLANWKTPLIQIRWFDVYRQVSGRGNVDQDRSMASGVTAACRAGDFFPCGVSAICDAPEFDSEFCVRFWR